MTAPGGGARAPGGALRRLAALPEAELTALYARSPGADPAALAGTLWGGWNVRWFTRLAGIQKFVKGFFAGPDGLEGYNIPARQDGLEAPWARCPSERAPQRFGFYTVRPAPRPGLAAPALLLDYGASARNALWRPERLLRDWLVRPEPSEPDVLLGRAYLRLGGLVHSNFFVLQRIGEDSWRP